MGKVVPRLIISAAFDSGAGRGRRRSDGDGGGARMQPPSATCGRWLMPRWTRPRGAAPTASSSASTPPAAAVATACSIGRAGAPAASSLAVSAWRDELRRGGRSVLGLHTSTASLQPTQHAGACSPLRRRGGGRAARYPAAGGGTPACDADFVRPPPVMPSCFLRNQRDGLRSQEKTELLHALIRDMKLSDLANISRLIYRDPEEAMEQDEVAAAAPEYAAITDYQGADQWDGDQWTSEVAVPPVAPTGADWGAAPGIYCYLDQVPILIWSIGVDEVFCIKPSSFY